MADNSTSDSYGNYKDNGGATYNTPDNKPPSHGTPVSIPNGDGTSTH